MKNYLKQLDPEGKHLIVCFLAVLALTIFARGFAGSAQARVTITLPQSRTMTGTFQAIGTLTPLVSQTYPVPQGLTLEPAARVGDALEAGDAVALADPAELDELLTRRSAEKTQLEVQIEALLEDIPPSDDAVTAAKNALAQAKERKTECARAVEEAQAALDDAQEPDIPAAQDALREAQRQEQEAEAALQEARTMLKQAEEAYADAQTQARRQKEVNQAQASVLRLDLDQVCALLDSLSAIRDAGYAVTAPARGILAELGTDYFSMTNPNGGNLLSFSLSPEDAALLTARTKVTITRGELTAEVSGCVPNADGTAFTVPMVKSGWESGPAAVQGTLWEERCDTCVPVEALRRDSGGYFLFILERRASLWSVEQTVGKVYVYPERMDGAYAAVSGLEPGQQVVVTSSKPLTEGSRVRVTP